VAAAQTTLQSAVAAAVESDFEGGLPFPGADFGRRLPIGDLLVF
jgi:hypothetical protein